MPISVPGIRALARAPSLNRALFILSSAVQMYEFSYIHCHNEISFAILCLLSFIFILFGTSGGAKAPPAPPPARALHSMVVEDFSFCVDDSGTEYVTFKENPTKTRQGGLNTKHRSILPKMFATGDPRRPVQLLKQYLSKRPQELREKGPFYLAIIENPKTNVWYKKQRLDVNSIDNMMKSVVKDTPQRKARRN